MRDMSGGSRFTPPPATLGSSLPGLKRFARPLSSFLFPLSAFHLPVFPDCQLPGGVPGSFHKKATDPFGSVAGFDGSRRLIV